MATLTKEKINYRTERLENKEALTGIYEDECTWLAETLNGSMRTSFDFKLINGELYSQEKDENDILRQRNLRKMYEEGADYAKKRATEDPRVVFEIEREKQHLIELEIMEQMAAGQAPNTMVVISPFPESLADEPEEDIQGYKPKLRRSMLRVITADERGIITVKTQSLDNTNKQALFALYKEMDWSINEAIDSEQMLAERIHTELSKEEQSALTDRLMNAYDSEMSRQKGGVWRAGRRQQENRGDTWQFVIEQDDILKQHLEDIAPLVQRIREASNKKYEKELESLRYIAAATMRDRYEGKQKHAEDVASEMYASASAAAEKGEEFGGCGLTAVMRNEDMMQKMGYRAEDALKCVTCPFCSAVVNAQRTSSGIKCSSCKKERRHDGRIVDHSHDLQPAFAAINQKTIWDYLQQSKAKQHNYIIEEELGVGGSYITIKDRKGNIIADGKAAEKLKRSL